MILLGAGCDLVRFDAASIYSFFLETLKANVAFVLEGLEVREESQIMAEDLPS